MSKIADRLRAPVMEAAQHYDDLRGRRGDFMKWIRIYFAREDDDDTDNSKRATHTVRMRDDPVYRKGYERRTAEERAEAERERAKTEKARALRAAYNDRKTKLANLGRRVEGGLYVSTLIAGRPIGEIRYSQLAALARASAFEASLARQILARGKPPTDARVRDLVSERDLRAMVANARVEAA